MTDASSLPAEIWLPEQGLVGPTPSASIAAPSSMYREPEAVRTTAKYRNGISHQEVKRLSGSLHFMRKKKLSMWWCVVGDDLLDMETGEARQEIGRVLTMLVRYQERADLPQYWTRGLEITGGLHANVIFPGNEAIADSLRRAFPQYMRGPSAMQPVDDVYGLVGYLSKEMTSTATRALNLRPSSRRYGSHRLEGDGDRVSLSRALRRDALAAGAVQPWKATNAKRAPFVTIWPKRAENTLRPSGQLLLFPELEKPVTRLNSFYGGLLSPSAALELEYRRRRCDLPQHRLAEIIGISQSHYANVARGHDRMSRHTARRLKEALLHDKAA